MKRIAVFDAKKYDEASFKPYLDKYTFTYFKDRLSNHTVALAKDFDAVICFVNDELMMKYSLNLMYMVYMVYSLDVLVITMLI